MKTFSESAEIRQWCTMTYVIEIELPGSHTWFNYMTGIKSREEAENIKREAEGKVKIRVKRVLRA